mmetsp:Transcript_9704/g.18506  ORF Transcript_9704/g.18506 Transcript_9704/m.18506 type:complete len:328 (+) Transcript_9704:58-1041(+)
MELRSGFATVAPGVDLHFKESGAGNNVVVLVHGWPEFWFAWRKQINHIASLGFRVIAIDLPGFGQSSAPTSLAGYSHKTVCGYLVNLLDFLGVDKGIFIGHDWGGSVVWKMALWQQHRVRAVAAFCTPYRPRSSKYLPIEAIAKMLPAFYYQVYFNKQGGQVAAAEIERDLPRFFKTMLRTSAKADSPGGRWVTNDKESFWGTLPSSLARSPLITEAELQRYIETYKKAGVLSSLKWYQTTKLNWEEEVDMPKVVQVPALMVTAGKDKVLSKKLTAGMEAWVPLLKRGHIEEAGHWILVEQPEQANSILSGWLQSLNSSHAPASSKL